MKKIFVMVSLLLISISLYSQSVLDFTLEHGHFLGKSKEAFYLETEAVPNFDYNIFIPFGKFNTMGHEALTDLSTGLKYYLDVTFEDNKVVSVTKYVRYSDIVKVFRELSRKLYEENEYIPNPDSTSWFYKLEDGIYVWITVMQKTDEAYIMFMTKEKFKVWFPSLYGQKK